MKRLFESDKGKNVKSKQYGFPVKLIPLLFIVLLWAPIISFDIADAADSRRLTAKKPRRTYVIVDTGQKDCYNNYSKISKPSPGQPFYGQDGNYNGPQPSYRDNGDGTITDLNTGLMWQKTPDLKNKSSYDEAVAGAKTLRLGGYDDWRLPTVKELYSLIDFNGYVHTRTPYINTKYFDFAWGNTGQERVIDAQYATSTIYKGRTMGGNETMFGVNFADGRIKGYPMKRKKFFVRYVRGNPDYGKNRFVDNGDGTITDKATGLTWQQNDSGKAMTWQQALEYAENLNYAGKSDWRLPNAKELQSIVDYTRSPQASGSKKGPAIDPIFKMTQPESYFWTGTTHFDGPPHIGAGSRAVYVCFGQAWGFFHGRWMDVHGAGAQRSDPKVGDPRNYPRGFGPQGDDIRIYNYVRCVRN